MDRKSFYENYDLEDSYWWFLGRRRIVATLVDKFLEDKKDKACLDVGCGTGIVLNDMSQKGMISFGVDLSEVALEYCMKRGHSKIARADALDLPFSDKTFDVVTILGVLYNSGIKDDLAAIKECARVIKNGGLLIIDEAAFNFLQTKHNKDVGGIRRFSRKELIDKCADAGLRVLKASYWDMLLFPGFFIIAMFENMFSRRNKYSNPAKVPAWVNLLLKKYLYMEAFLLKYLNILIGPSIILVAKK